MEHIQEVPFLYLKSRKDALKVEIVEALSSSIESSNFIMGAGLGLFENEIAACCGFEFAQGASLDTAALHLAFFPGGTGPGGEAPAVQSFFAAPVESILNAGSKSVLREAHDDTSCIHNQKVSIPDFPDFSSSQLEDVVDNLGKITVPIKP